jgi:hypothetical protein
MSDETQIWISSAVISIINTSNKSLSTQLFFNHRHNVHQTRRRRHAPALPHGDVGIRLRSARRIAVAVLTADAPYVLCSSGGRVSSLLVSMQLYADAVGGCALCVLYD